MRLIDADALINDLETINPIYDTKWVKSIVEAQPTFESRPKGEWIGAEYDGYADGQPVYDVFECSNCGEIIFATDDTLTPFCPHCGADMRGNQDVKR